MYTSPLKQSGNVALMTAMLTMLFSFTSVLSLDVGRVYFERESLKKLSETVALDVVANSNIFNGESVGDVSTLALESVARNGFDPDAEGFTISARRIAIETDDDGAWRIPEDSNSAADHVLVEITKEIPSSLFFDLQQILDSDEEVSDTLTVSVSSVARRSVYAAFSTESRLLSVDSSKSPLLEQVLVEMLGVEVDDLALISSSGLLSQDVQVGELIDAFVSIGAAAEIDSVSSLLALEITALQLLEAVEDARQDAMLLNQRQAISSMIDKASPNIADRTFALGDILLLETAYIPLAYIEAIPLRLDALLETAIMTANAEVIQTISDLPYLSGLAGLTAEIEIVTPPAIAIGPPGCAHIGSPCEEWRTKGRNAQINLNIDTDIRLLGIASSKLEISVEGVQGTAWLDSVQRPDQGNYSQALFGANSRLADLETSFDVKLLDEISFPLPLICGQCLLNNILSLSFSNEDQSALLSGDDNMQAVLSWPNGATSITLHPSVSNSVFDSLDEATNQLNINLSSDFPLISSILGLINPVISNLVQLESALEQSLLDGVRDSEVGLAALLNPTLDALGISVNDITIELLGISASPAEVVI